MIDIALRRFESTDIDFFYSSFIKSYSKSGFGRSVPANLYYDGMRRRVNRLLGDKNNGVIIACDPQVPEMIYGWLLFGRNNIIHYIYVKANYRLQGIASMLVGAAIEELEPVLYTHRPNEIWAEQKIKNDPQLITWLYDPFLLEQA